MTRNDYGKAVAKGAADRSRNEKGMRFYRDLFDVGKRIHSSEKGANRYLHPAYGIYRVPPLDPPVVR